MKVCAHHDIRKTIASLFLCSIQSTSTARFAEAVPLEMAQTQYQNENDLMETMEDVKRSGYFYMICNNIEEAWRLCDPEAEHKEDNIFPVYEDCGEISSGNEDLVEQCGDVNTRLEVKCRNSLLLYYSKLYSSEPVYEALSVFDNERKWLVDTCRSISIANEEIPVFPLRDEAQDYELIDALAQGDQGPRGLPSLRLTTPKSWEHTPNQDVDPTLSLGDETTQIGEKYSVDLDLFFTGENVSDLFNYKYGHFQKICQLIRTTLQTPSIKEKNELLATLTETAEFNYISEENYARDTLFYICSFNTYFSKDDQEFVASNKPAFDLLFQ